MIVNECETENSYEQKLVPYIFGVLLIYARSTDTQLCGNAHKFFLEIRAANEGTI